MMNCYFEFCNELFWSNPSQATSFHVSHENTKEDTNVLELLDDHEVETSDVLGEDNNKAFFQCS